MANFDASETSRVEPKFGVSKSTFDRLNEARASSNVVGLKMWVQFNTLL